MPPRETISEIEEDTLLDDQDYESSLSIFRKMSENSLFRELQIYWDNFTYSNVKEGTRWFVESATVSMSFDDLMMLMTLFVLFADEIRILAAPKEADYGFEIVNSICLFAFIFELLAVTWSKSKIVSVIPFKTEGYFGNFFFYLDIIAILSMIPDIGWISRDMGALRTLNESNDLSVVRMVRLVRLVKLYKVASERRRSARIEQELYELVRQGALTYDEVAAQRSLYQQRQSKVGGQLSDSITRRVILIILVMLVGVRIIQQSISYQPEGELDYIFGTHLMNQYNAHGDIAAKTTSLNLFQDHFKSVHITGRTEPFLLKVGFNPADSFAATGVSLTDETNTQFYKDLRAIHIDEVNSGSIACNFTITTSCVTMASFSTFYLAQEEAILQIVLTVVVSILLVFGAILFTNDAQRLVLGPIERMMNMVEAVAKNPLQPLHFDHSGSGTGEYETRLLETAIEKITELLRVGFGEAGAGIISANLDIEDRSSVINPLIPGVRIYAIFGFCDIHHFDDINLVMEKDVLTFVNTVAEIVHSSVHEWGGQSNKNLGNAFLMIWRMGDEATILEQISGGKENVQVPSSRKVSSSFKPKKVVDLRRIPGIDALADKALIGYVKIIAELNRSSNVLAYRKDQRLTKNGTEDYKVRMGFGLHAGWAIEGAVGSLQKVDATYLSPHVNMAARLETSSKQFKVPLLFSQALYDIMSSEVQEHTRRCDIVTVKGSEQPIAIYTYDCLQDQIFQKKTRPKAFAVRPKLASQLSMARGVVKAGDRPRERARVTAMQFFQGSTDADSAEIMNYDFDLVQLRQHVPQGFKELFTSSIDAYIAGDWPSAAAGLSECDQMMAKAAPSLGGDGPSQTLISYMANRNNTAPKDWKGYRPLTSK